MNKKFILHKFIDMIVYKTALYFVILLFFSMFFSVIVNAQNNSQSTNPSVFLEFTRNQKKVHLPDTVRKRLDDSQSQSVILILDDSEDFEDFAQLNYQRLSRAGKKIALNGYRDNLKRINNGLIQLTASVNAEIKKSYKNLPVALVQIPNNKALEAIAKSSKVKGIYENTVLDSMPLT